MLAVVIGGAAAGGAGLGRLAQLGNVPILLVAAAVAALGAMAAMWLFPRLFLGSHGMWAYRESEALLRRRVRPRGTASDVEGLAPAPKGSSKV
jgi:hypothetical protein